jgi:unsaturated rhamnogalacturonyl hydrolase
MKYYIVSIILVLTFSQLLEINAQYLSPKDSVIKQMELANDYFMAKWPDPGADIVTDKSRPSNLWTRAAYYEGLMALYYINEDINLYNYAVDWGESHNWETTYGIPDSRDGDYQCCGQTYIELYQISDNADWIVPITENINNMVDDDKNDDWWWVDAIQMSMPVFAKLGVVYNDTNYFDKMYKLYSFTKYQHGENGLYNPDDHLWWRDGNFDPPETTPAGKEIYWSRGNGWVYAALVRVLSVIPDNETHREEYISDFLEMTNALVALQREDGFWNPSLVDPEHYGGKETSGTAFFVYGLAWGINNDYLDSATYMPYVTAGWEGMVNYALHDNGFLGWVQGTGKEPKDGQPLSYTKPANFEDFGLGAFLLAGSEVYKLAPEMADVPYALQSIRHKNADILLVYPNPGSDQFTISYQLRNDSRTNIQVLDSDGHLVTLIENDTLKSPGVYRLKWIPAKDDGSELPKGIYLIKLTTEESIYINKILII